MTENDPKFAAFKDALRTYLLDGIREFLELLPNHPNTTCLTVDAEWDKKFTSIWMMFSPDERVFLLHLIDTVPPSLLPRLARAVVAGGAYKRRIEELHVEMGASPKH